MYSEKLIAEIAADLQTKVIGNPHTTSGPEIFAARRELLAHFNAKATDYSVIFTSGQAEP